jgi:hypothetical protein
MIHDNIDNIVARFVSGKVPGLHINEQVKDFVALGWVVNLKLVAGVLLTDYRNFDVTVHLAADGNWPVRGLLRHVAKLVFIDWHCRRMTALVSKKNTRARRFVQGVGFKEEGRLKYGYDGVTDGILYGMTRENCRWI